MAKARKDNKGRALRKGESQRTDNTYVYTYTDPFKKRRFVYAKDLQTLREKQEKLKREQRFSFWSSIWTSTQPLRFTSSLGVERYCSY